MRKIKEVLRLTFDVGLGLRQVARSCSIGLGTAHEYLQRAEAAKITWPLGPEWDDDRLEAALFGGPPRSRPAVLPVPDFADLHRQRQQHPHVTQQLLWEEYPAGKPGRLPVQPLLRAVPRWRRKQDVVLRQEHRPARSCLWIGREQRRSTPTTIEIFHKSQRVASHLRARGHGHAVTIAEHRPRSHQAHLEWPPSRMVHWAQTIGPHTARLFERILADKPHPEMGYRSCLGIIRLADQYSPARVEAASERALLTGARRYQSVKSILKNALDQQRLGMQTLPPSPSHDNIRRRGVLRIGAIDMLEQPMIEKLLRMRLQGMADALKAQEQDPGVRELSFAERLSLRVDQQLELAREPSAGTATEERQTPSRRGIEDIDYRAARGLEKAVIRGLAKDS